MRARWVPAWTLGLVVAAGACASGQQAPSAPAVVIEPELMSRAAAEGRVRVVVGLRVSEAEDRRLAIETAWQRVLRDIAQTPHRVLRTFDTIPFVALEASSDTLRALALSPHVVSVQADTLAAPQPVPRRGP